MSATIRKTFTHICMSYMGSPQMGFSSGTPWNLSIPLTCSRQGSLKEVAVEVDLKA